MFRTSLSAAVCALVALMFTTGAGAAPGPYVYARTCLEQHHFTITHEAHGANIGWELTATVPWRLNGGTGTDRAILVVGSSAARARVYEARLLRVMRGVFKAIGVPDDPARYLHRRGRVVYGWLSRPETRGDQLTLARCVPTEG